MTNAQIIYTESIKAGLFTAEQANAIIATGRRLPVHTFAEWKKLGYSIKKGEKARFITSIWLKTRRLTDWDGKEIEMETPYFYKEMAHFFSIDQVQKIN